jgi:hypothetical protein
MQQGLESGADRVALALGVQRSPLWDTARKTHLAIKEQSYCAVCQSTERPQVHHIIPFHFCHLVYRGDLELDERNLMTLCEVPQNNHHLLLGHLDDWEIYNPSGRNGIVGAFQGKLAEQLTADQIQVAEIWTQWMAEKPSRWTAMQPQDKMALRNLLDTTLPFIPTPEYAEPYPYTESDSNAAQGDPGKIATTYGDESRLQVFFSQVNAESGSATGTNGSSVAADVSASAPATDTNGSTVSNTASAPTPDASES